MKKFCTSWNNSGQWQFIPKLNVWDKTSGAREKTVIECIRKFLMPSSKRRVYTTPPSPFQRWIKPSKIESNSRPGLKAQVHPLHQSLVISVGPPPLDPLCRHRNLALFSIIAENPSKYKRFPKFKGPYLLSPALMTTNNFIIHIWTSFIRAEFKLTKLASLKKQIWKFKSLSLKYKLIKFYTKLKGELI